MVCILRKKSFKKSDKIKEKDKIMQEPTYICPFTNRHFVLYYTTPDKVRRPGGYIFRDMKIFRG